MQRAKPVVIWEGSPKNDGSKVSPSSKEVRGLSKAEELLDDGGGVGRLESGRYVRSK